MIEKEKLYYQSFRVNNPDSIIHPDQWRAYSRINSELQLEHGTVHHSVNFVDPETGVYMIV